MAGSLCKWLAAAALGACIAASSAHAATGRIVFSGAVVESTCSSESVSAAVAVDAGGSVTGERRSCGRSATEAGRSYSRRVARLSTAGLAHDPLLTYFASYAGPTVAGKIVVQTYD